MEPICGGKTDFGGLRPVSVISSVRVFFFDPFLPVKAESLRKRTLVKNKTALENDREKWPTVSPVSDSDDHNSSHGIPCIQHRYPRRLPPTTTSVNVHDQLPDNRSLEVSMPMRCGLTLQEPNCTTTTKFVNGQRIRFAKDQS